MPNKDYLTNLELHIFSVLRLPSLLISLTL